MGKKPIWFHLVPCATRYTCTSFLDTHLRFAVSIFTPFVVLSVFLSLIWLCPSDLHAFGGQATLQLFFSQSYCSLKNLRWASNSYLTFILNHSNPFTCFNNESDNYNTDLVFAWECDLISLLSVLFTNWGFRRSYISIYFCILFIPGYKPVKYFLSSSLSCLFS